MFYEITGEKEVCLKRKINNRIFRVLIFENIITLLPTGQMFVMVNSSNFALFYFFNFFHTVGFIFLFTYIYIYI